MDSEKKRHERFLLDRFLERQEITPTCIHPFESPDFLIELEGRKVGIELTELFKRSNRSEAHPQLKDKPLLQAVESITDLIVSKARKIYFDAGNPPVQSTILFSDQLTADKKKADQIAELIAGLIQSMSLQDSEEVSWGLSEDEYGHPLSELVDTIHTYRVPECRFAHWTVGRPGLVAPLTPKHLQEVIGEKAKRLDAYKKHAKEIWLLIVADCTHPSQMFYVAPDFPLGLVSSPFTKTFYYGYPMPDGVIDLTNTTRVSK
jgi:hypothetical protein